MRRLSSRSFAVAAAAAALGGSSAFAPAANHPGVPAITTVQWGRITSNTREGIASAGVYRTPDARLHVVWQSHDGTTFSLHYSTLGTKAKLLTTGTILSKWAALTTYPRLVPGPGGGIRLVFTGANGIGGSPYNLSTMYSATSGAAGGTWSLTHGSMSQSKLVPLTDDAAVNESNGTPVAAWSTGAAALLAYHVGVDPTTPATAPDRSVSTGAAGVVVGPTLVRDKSGNVWGAWFNESGTSTQGYYVDQILPTTKPRVKAPSSGGKTSNNQPGEAVAFTARVGGGLYLAYCVPTKTVLCAHIDLWRVGSTNVHVVPGSGTGHVSNVAIAAGPNGHLSIGWYDEGVNKIRLIRTNSAATGFGSVKTINAPPSTTLFEGLQLEGSKGPLDVIALTFQIKSGVTAFWATEVAP